MDKEVFDCGVYLGIGKDHAIKHHIGTPQPSRNDTLEEVAKEFDKMKVFGDTAASFAIFVREMKS